MRFGNLLNTATSFLTDTLGKVNKFAEPIRGVARAIDQLGIGGGRVGRFVNKGLGFADKAQRSLTEFGEMSPAQKAERLGSLAGRAGGSLLGQGLERLGAGGGQAREVGRGLGQIGGGFLSQGLQRLLG